MNTVSSTSVTTNPPARSTSTPRVTADVVTNPLDAYALYNTVLIDCKQRLSGTDKAEALDGWNFGLDHAKRRLGCCHESQRRITISKYLLLGGVRRTVLENTLRHELAHAATPRHHHDSVWREMALRLGCDGERCGDGTALREAAPRKVRFFCPCGRCDFKKYKVPSYKWLERRRCRQCKGSLKVERLS